MSRKIDYKEGDKIGDFIVIREVPPYIKKNGSAQTKCLFRCHCGNEFETTVANIKSGNTKSCGCLNTHTGMKTHGECKTRLYTIWANMITRTTKPNENYSDRGISICDEWLTYKAFADWSKSNGYKESLTIDRIDNDGDYTPENCRWADYKTQRYNQRVRKDNKLGITGVSFHKASGLYRVQFQIDGEKIHVGCYKTIEQAKSKRDEFIRLNELNGKSIYEE